MDNLMIIILILVAFMLLNSSCFNKEKFSTKLKNDELCGIDWIGCNPKTNKKCRYQWPKDSGNYYLGNDSACESGNCDCTATFCECTKKGQSIIKKYRKICKKAGRKWKKGECTNKCLKKNFKFNKNKKKCLKVNKKEKVKKPIKNKTTKKKKGCPKGPAGRDCRRMENIKLGRL